MNKNTSCPGVSLNKKFRLVCVFSEKTQDEEEVKADIRKILAEELKHQMQCQAEADT